MKRQRLIVGLLTACAVLLAVNLFTGSTLAQGGGVVAGPQPPTVVAGAVADINSGERVYRFWSDGVVDRTDVVYTGTCNFNTAPCNTQEVIQPCPGDANSDGFVDVEDLTTVILAWGDCEVPPGEE